MRRSDPFQPLYICLEWGRADRLVEQFQSSIPLRYFLLDSQTEQKKNLMAFLTSISKKLWLAGALRGGRFFATSKHKRRWLDATQLRHTLLYSRATCCAYRAKEMLDARAQAAGTGTHTNTISSATSVVHGRRTTRHPRLTRVARAPIFC